MRQIIDKLFVRDRSFYQRLLAIAIPVILQGMITIGVNIMDTVMLGTYGEIQLSASSLAGEFINLFQILCMGMGCGAAVLTAQYYGRGDYHSLRQTVSLMLRICFVLASIFTLMVLFIPRQIMQVYTPDTEVIEKGILYLRWSAITFITTGLALTLTQILRSVREVRVPLIATIIAFFTNIFFNWVFIFGHLGAPEMQIAGAALGTVIARVFEALIIAGYLFIKEDKIRYRISNILMPCADHMKVYLKFSIPVIISDFLLSLGNNMVSVIIGHIGPSFVAANAIIVVVIRLCTVFNMGLSSSSSVLTGNTLGTGDGEKAYHQGVTFLTLSFCIGLFAALLIQLLAPCIISLYNITEETRSVAYQLMAAVSITVIFQTTQGVLTKGILRGGGDTKFLMIADIFFLWVVSVPLGALAGLVWHLSPFLVYICLKSEYFLKTVLCTFRLKSKKWIRIV